MVEYGNPSQFVRLIIKLETVGPVPVIVGKGVVLLVGRSVRGPVDEAVAMTSSSAAKTYFYSGGLRDAIELAFAQGAPVVYAVRVLGTGHATASVTLDDGLDTPNDVVKISAKSPGLWGNAVSIKVLEGSYKATETTPYAIPGAGTVGPYYTQYTNIIANDSANWVRVDGVPYTEANGKLVYTAPPTADQVYVNTIDGSITFGTLVAATSLITYSLKYKTVKLVVTDNETTYTYDNISSLTKLVARLIGTGFVSATAITGETHLPATSVTPFALSGGLDGTSISTSDWEEALRVGGAAAAELVGAPQTCALTEYEVEEGTHDLIPVLDAWSMEMANDFHPCQCFIGVAPNLTAEQVLDIAAGYSNRLLTIVANSWDNSTTSRNIAVARAGKEAAVALGESAALPRNAMNGLNGLLNTYDQTDVDVMTQDTDARADVIIKSRGIRPYVGITTDQTWQFLRTVDNRTINYVIVASDQIARQYFHEKRTGTIMSAMEQSIKAILNDLMRDENIRAYSIEVTPDETDTGKVNIRLCMENIGHIERIDETIAVGILSDQGTGVITEVE
jgi:hypothetical protein